jgi:hypothetical protein
MDANPTISIISLRLQCSQGNENTANIVANMGEVDNKAELPARALMFCVKANLG